MEVKVFRQDGTDTGRTVTLDPSVFGVEPNDHALWLDVRSIQANARQGTHKAKTRGEVAGSTRKLYRQKGTGYARAGSAKSPIRRSGGTIFGPQPRTYKVNINRKTKQLARRSALAYKAREEAIRIVETFDFETPSTKQLTGVLDALGLKGQKVLLLTGELLRNVHLSGRNLPKVQVQRATDVSTVDLLNARVLLFQENALAEISSQLAQDQPAIAE